MKEQYAEIQTMKNLRELKENSKVTELELGITQNDIINDIKKLSKKEQMDMARRMVGL